jgi:ABC-type antimicrobial peptide transport system permease subunit
MIHIPTNSFHKTTLLVALSAIIIAMFAFSPITASGNDTLFQTSTINALLEGVYDGDTDINTLSKHGDLGIGTFNALDGEMIVLNGTFYQIKSDGKAYVVSNQTKTPFAAVTHFASDQMFFVIIIILSLIGWAGTARVLRGMTLSLRQNQYVMAAESMGQSPFVILRKHILPNLMSYLLVAATLSIPGYILGEAALSFLGLGIQEPSASWGLMLSQAQDVKVFYLNFWWLLTPGFAIFVTVIAYNVLGDVLRDVVDPKMKTR